MADSQDTPAAARLPHSIGSLCAAQVGALGHQPLLTFYDDTTGERTELSWATFDNWASKTANLLVEELAARRGARVALGVTHHWIGAVVAVAAWKVGAAVAPAPGASDVPDASVLVVAEDDPRAGGGHPGLVVVGAGMGGRVAGAVGGIAYGDEVPAFGDDYDDPAVTLDDVGLVAGDQSLTQGELLAAAWGMLGAGERVLSTVALTDIDGVVGALLAPVAAGASVVWCPRAGDAGVDLDERAASERCTRIV